MSMSLKKRRTWLVVLVGLLLAVALFTNADNYTATVQEKKSPASTASSQASPIVESPAIDALAKLPVKGRAAKTGYARTQFGNGWADVQGCSTREIILNRDMVDKKVEDCKVMSGTLHDPYTGKDIAFTRGAQTSAAVQIDHVVALSNAWQTGAQQLSAEVRKQLANDPLELLAVDGLANQQKSDGDAATWLPSSKAFRCQYVARQIAVKTKYNLWVTQPEKDAITRILSACPGQMLPSE